MKTLTEQFTQWLRYADDHKMKRENILSELLEVIKERDEYVIGFDTQGDQINNMLRAELRKRLQESI